jgi:methylenetetrahydrofolate dehydrogenase (NADP+) / methenyltetrahydrofolate cyclohydrolase
MITGINIHAGSKNRLLSLVFPICPSPSPSIYRDNDGALSIIYVKIFSVADYNNIWTTMQFLETKAIAMRHERKILQETEAIRKDHKIVPKLGILVVTGDQISMAQAEKVIVLGPKLGFEVQKETISERNVDRLFAQKLEGMVSDESYMALWVVTPRFDFPPYDLITQILPFNKDVTGCHHYSFGRYMFGKPGLIPPKVRAIFDILEEQVEGYREKGVVIISTKNDGTRGFFGKYLAGFLYDQGARATIRNILAPVKTTRKAIEVYNPFGEVIVTALNTSRAITADRLKKGSIIIDTGYNFLKHSITGDVDLNAARSVCSAITPVPGGVDSLIPINILINTLDIVKSRIGMPRVQIRRERPGRIVR